MCLFLCQTSLGHCRSKDSKPRSSPAERLFYEREGLCPKHPKYSCITFSGTGSAVQPQLALYPHETEFRTDLKHLWWERQLTFPTAYSSVQFFKYTISKTAQNKGTFSQAAWASKHTRLPLKCPVLNLKGSITKMPKPKMSHIAGHTAELLWKLAFPLGLIRSADLAHPHPPRFHICNYHWKSHTSGIVLELRQSFPMTGQELIESPSSECQRC